MKRYKVYCLLIILILFLMALSGCSSNNDLKFYDIHGTITTESLDKPIEGAVVSIAGKSKTTDEHGNYMIKDIKEGRYDWKVESEEYLDVIKEVLIDGDNINISEQLILDTLKATITGTVNVYNNSEEYDLQNTANISTNIESVSLKSTKNKSEYKEGQIIVNFKEMITLDNINKFAKSYNLSKIKKIDLKDNNVYLFSLPNDKRVIELIEILKNHNIINWVEPNYFMHLTATPNDLLYEQQWGNRKINSEAAWDIVDNNKKIKVAVIDSGIIPDHDDLSANINLNAGRDFVDDDFNPIDESSEYSHGTHVSGLIGAVINNNTGIAGVLSNVEIIPIRVFDPNGTVQTISDIVEAINYAVEQNADVINMSFGGGESFTMHEAIKEAHKSGIILVASAGNTGDSGVIYPASFPETIAVGATDINNNRAFYSNTGENLDLVAPGGEGNGIVSTSGYYNNGNIYTNLYVNMEGTSMATSYVSGVAALLLSNGVSPLEIRDRLTSTAVDLGPDGRDVFFGHGLVDAYAALINKRLKKPYVFAANRENGTLNIKSEFIKVNDDNTYKLENLVEGNVIVVAWRDVDEDGKISAGDYYGEYGSEINVLENNLYNNIDIDMYYIQQSETTNIDVMNMP
ncbi:MAG: S8 family serine peptidase [Bacillota bacterium]